MLYGQWSNPELKGHMLLNEKARKVFQSAGQSEIVVDFTVKMEKWVVDITKEQAQDFFVDGDRWVFLLDDDCIGSSGAFEHEGRFFQWRAKTTLDGTARVTFYAYHG